MKEQNERKGGKEKKEGKKRQKKRENERTNEREGDGFTGVEERGY